jgi:RNA polymerase sigma factor (sigma-70 family)
MTIAAIRTTPLTAADERALHAAMQGPDRAAARETFAARNRGLVVRIARRWQGRGVELDDLIQFGFLGLVTAIDRFDPERGRFSTYATPWVEQAIRRGIADTSRPVRLPVYLHERVNAVRRAQATLEQAHERTATDAELADAVGVTLGEAQRARVAQRVAATPASLDAPLRGADELSLGAIIGDGSDHAASIADALERRADAAMVRAAVAALPERHRLVVTWRFGLSGEVLTHDQVAARLGVVRETARTAQDQALRMLRNAIIGTYDAPVGQGGD